MQRGLRRLSEILPALHGPVAIAVIAIREKDDGVRAGVEPPFASCSFDQFH